MFVEGVLRQDQAVSWLNAGSVKVGPARGIPPYITYISPTRESNHKTLFYRYENQHTISQYISLFGLDSLYQTWTHLQAKGSVA